MEIVPNYPTDDARCVVYGVPPKLPEAWIVADHCILRNLQELQ
jgi:hypothetical protein